MVWESGQEASQIPPWGGVSAMSRRSRRRTRWRDYIYWLAFGFPRGAGGNDRGAECLYFLAEAATHGHRKNSKRTER